ncbi:MAG TPA: GNAT family N-acetyltransferase [Thermoanaerobaculia bacterium]|jgi:hypothetical protein|nr:GNAT family N-acetyltransferase [Thermoanaerobaculia bacterium]
MQFREASSADRDAILDLRARCFGDVDPEKRDPRFWDWEFGRARIFVGEEDGRLATHLALIDMPGAAALAVDAMTAPEARGTGAFTGVVSYAMRSTNFPITTAYQIRAAVLSAMLRGGFVTAERVPILIRPILFRSTGRTTGDILRREDCEWMGRIARTPEFLAWRFFDNPLWQYRVTGVRDRAYLVARRTVLKGYDTFAIADFAWRDARAARDLLRRAIADARREGCTLIAAFVSRAHPAFRFLLLRGFLPGPHWFRLLVHPAHEAKRTWRVMWADTDHL